MNRTLGITLLLVSLLSYSSKAQFDEDQTGAWYMLFWSYNFENSQFGLQGDYQYRSWNAGGDMEQFMFRNGLTYRPKNTNIKLTAGFARIVSGAFGESNDTSGENRFYLEGLVPHKIGNRIHVTHRYRAEHRNVAGQDARSRFRYFLSVNVPLNQTDLSKGAIYFAFYDEIFVNGQKDIGDGQSVSLFDRNRIYGGFGYSVSNTARVQLAVMRQSTNNWSKNQLQFSLHKSF